MASEPRWKATACKVLALMVVGGAALAGCAGLGTDMSGSECEAWVRDRQGTSSFNVSWSPPSRMVQGEEQTVHASVELAAMHAGGNQLDDVHCTIRADLEGDGFQTKLAGSPEQSFIDQPTRLDWDWSVLPEKSTRQGAPATLKLTFTPVSGTSTLNGRSQTFRASIDVAKGRDPRNLWRRINDVVGQPVIQALVGVLLTGASLRAVISAWRWWQRRFRPALTSPTA